MMSFQQVAFGVIFIKKRIRREIRRAHVWGKNRDIIKYRSCYVKSPPISHQHAMWHLVTQFYHNTVQQDQNITSIRIANGP